MTVTMTRFRRRQEALWRRVPDGVIVLQPSGDPVSVTGPGRALWDALAVGGTRTELARRLSSTFDVEEHRAVEVVDEVLGHLVDLGVVREEP